MAMKYETFNSVSDPQLDMIQEWIDKKRIEKRNEIKSSLIFSPHDYLTELNTDLMLDTYSEQCLKTKTEILEQNKQYDDKCKEVDSLKYNLNKLQKEYDEKVKDCNYRKKRIYEFVDLLKKGSITVDKICEEIQWW